MNSVPSKLPNGLLEHSRGIQKITDINPFTIRTGKYYYIRLNTTNPKDNREYTDLFVKIIDMTNKIIRVRILSTREYYKAWDTHDKYNVSANVAENGSISRLEHISTNDRQVFTAKKDIYDRILTQIDFYDNLIQPLEDEINETDNNADAERLEADIIDLKNEWYSTKYVLNHATGEPVPAKWEETDKEFNIPIQYISVNNSMKPYEYIVYGPISDVAPAAGGYRRRARKTRRRLRRT
jgi:hypothetical protein